MKCKYCNKEYSDKGNLILHQKECVMNPNVEEDIKLKCQYCRKRIYRKAN